MFRNLSDSLYELAVNGIDLTKVDTNVVGSRNSVQSQGDFLELIVKDFLCGVTPKNAKNRESLYASHLSYQGSKNNPPDAMFRGGDNGDAFEIKKKEKGNGGLALNSSYPYSHLESDLNRLLEETRQAEKWKRRDFFYVVGNASKTQSKGNFIWIAHGTIYAQDLNHYRKLESDLKPAIDNAIQVNGMDPGDTKELGRINKVDLLGRTDLRIRGMWGIQSPNSVFGNLPGVNETPTSHLVLHAVISESKWTKLLSDRSEEVKKFWGKSSGRMQMSDVKVQDPNNPQNLIPTKLIRIEVK
jgi:hypothetical protein